MAIFNSYVRHNQRVNPPFSYGFPMVFPLKPPFFLGKKKTTAGNGRCTQRWSKCGSVQLGRHRLMEWMAMIDLEKPRENHGKP